MVVARSSYSARSSRCEPRRRPGMGPPNVYASISWTIASTASMSVSAPRGLDNRIVELMLIVRGCTWHRAANRSLSVWPLNRRPGSVMTERAELLVTDVTEWRTWLRNNHASEQGIWLVLSKSGGRVTELTYAQALDEALCFGWIDGQIGQRDEQTYRRRFTPRRPSSSWSARNVEHVVRLTAAGRMHAAGLAAVDAAKSDGRWQTAYRGQASATVPPDLSDALAANPDAALTFEQLDSANRYSIIFRLDAVKRPETRARKLVTYIEMLNRGDSIHAQNERKKRGTRQVE